MTRYRFGEVSVDTETVEVVGPEGTRDVEPQVFDVLRYLIEQPGRLVTKEELLDNVWGDRFVSESALTTRIKQARRALGDDGRTQWAIKTVHGRGYRFVAEADDEESPTPVSTDDGAVAASPGALPDEVQADIRQMFIGREVELKQITALLTRPTDDRAFGWIWILGEPGIGKTRLAAEVARAAQGLGQRVFFGRNSEDLTVPHQPFIEMMRAAVDQLAPEQREAYVGQLAPELTPLLPGLVAGLQPADAVVGVDDETRRYRLFEAIASWLIERSGIAPLTVIIDDLHWAADSTLQVLSHLQKRTDGGRVTFVITTRDTAPDINPRVADVLAASQGVANSAVVRLGGLSGDDARKLVGQTVSLDEVMQQTAGNPLLLQAVNPADGSVDIQSAVHRRLAGLDRTVHETLQVAAILGLEFELRVAAATTSRDELDLLDDLEQAIAARLIDDIGVDRFRFSHALIRSSLRDDLSSARRARMHRRIADAIDQVFGEDPQHLPALAFHVAEAAEVDRSLVPVAIERLEMAASESMSQLSFEEAADSLDRAIGLLDGPDAMERARLTLERGIAENRAGASTTAAATFEQALALARTADDPLLRIESALRFEDATWRPGLSGQRALVHLDEATEVLDEAIAADRSIGDVTALRTRLAVGRLRALALTGQARAAEAEFQVANTLARQLGSPTLEALAIDVYLGQVRIFQSVHGSQPLVDRLAELQPAIEDGDVALHAVHVRLLHAAMLGQHETVRDMADLMARLQEKSRSSFWMLIRAHQEAMEAFYRGDLDAAELQAERCLELADGSGTYGLRMFMIRREQDRLASIAPLVRRVLATGDITGVWTPGLAWLLAETGDADEAADLLRDIKSASFQVPGDAMWSTVMVFLIETVVALGDEESAAVLRDRFAVLAGTNVVMASGLFAFGRADRYLGMLSFVLGELDAAEEYLGAALEADSAGGSAVWSNESRLWLSRVRRAQGHAAEADAMLSVVAREAEAAGLARLARVATTESA